MEDTLSHLIHLVQYLQEITNRQLHVLVIGNLLEPAQVSTIIEREALLQTSILKAASGRLLQAVLSTRFVISVTVWEFLQNVIYLLEDSGKNYISPAVIPMRTALKKV